VHNGRDRHRAIPRGARVIVVGHEAHEAQQELLSLARNRAIVGIAWIAATTHGSQPSG